MSNSMARRAMEQTPKTDAHIPPCFLCDKREWPYAYYFEGKPLCCHHYCEILAYREYDNADDILAQTQVGSVGNEQTTPA
jgi:hypothetical protein